MDASCRCFASRIVLLDNVYVLHFRRKEKTIMKRGKTLVIDYISHVKLSDCYWTGHMVLYNRNGKAIRMSLHIKDDEISIGGDDNIGCVEYNLDDDVQYSKKYPDFYGIVDHWKGSYNNCDNSIKYYTEREWKEMLKEIL